MRHGPEAGDGDFQPPTHLPLVMVLWGRKRNWARNCVSGQVGPWAVMNRGLVMGGGHTGGNTRQTSGEKKDQQGGNIIQTIYSPLISNQRVMSIRSAKIGSSN